MKVVLVFFALFAFGNADLLGMSNQWWANLCLMGVWRNNPFLRPLCTVYYSGLMQECDISGRCWCVRSRNSPITRSGRSHTNGAVDCVKTIQNCPNTMTYQMCSGCLLSCKDRLKRPSCYKDCNPGCNCPPETYWNGRECVAAQRCTSESFPSFSTNSRSEKTDEEKELDADGSPSEKQ